MLKEKFIIAVSDDNDAVMYPLSRMLSMHHVSDDTIIMYFDPGISDAGTGADAEADLITLTVPNETERAVTLAILDAINLDYGAYLKNQTGYVVIKDDVDATNDMVSGITSCTITRGAV